MKATMKSIMLMLLVVAGISTFNSCKKQEPKPLPETITVSGQVTDKDGQPFDGVNVYVYESSFMIISIPVDNTITDDNGLYQIEFSPEEGNSYSLRFETTKDGERYYHRYYLDSWEAEQVYDVVLEKE